VIRDLKVGEAGYAYIVTRSGDIIAHSDTALALQRVNAGRLAQVLTAFQPNPVVPKPRSLLARDLNGANVLSSSAFLPNLDWAVLVEQPLTEAYASVYQAMLRTSAILLVGFGIAVLASIVVAARVVGPVEALRLGAERIGKGDLNYQLKIQTGDEIEILAEEFNNMVGQLRKAHDTLEQRVEQRTKELAVLYDVTAAATQSLDLKAVLHDVSKRITDTFAFDATRIFLLDSRTGQLEMQASFGAAQTSVEHRRGIRLGQGTIGAVFESGEPLIFQDVNTDPRYEQLSSTQAAHRAGFCFAGFFPIKAKGKSLGIIFCGGRGPRVLTADEVRLITSIAEQIGGAVDNMNLFEEVRMANYRLKELDRMKSDFVSNVSHELRTPLTAIQALIDNMLDGITGALNQKQAHYVTDIRASAERLARLIDDLLDLSVIEAGKIELTPTTFPVPALIDEVIKTFTPMARENLLTIGAAKIPDDLKAWADRDKIIQVLTNLIGNAVKFTPSQGRIYVAAEKSGEFIEISVNDTGPGIEREELKRIFEPFYQVRESGGKKSRGVGLGLAITKKLVELHGGKIQAASVPGQGSRVSFTIPIDGGDQADVLAVGEQIHGANDGSDRRC
jgi:signal transduction histidine kinase